MLFIALSEGARRGWPPYVGDETPPRLGYASSLMGSDPGGNVPRLNDLDTVPPPDGGDAYGNATVVRAAPSEILDAIRRDREREAKRVDPRAEPEEPQPTGSEGKFLAAQPAKKLDAVKIVAETSPKPDVKPVAEPAAPPSDSSDVHVPQGAEPTASKLPAMDAAALRPARVPQDFDKLMSQRTDASLVGMSAQPTATDDVDVPATSNRRGKLVITVVVGVLVLWLAIMAAMFASHLGNG